MGALSLYPAVLLVPTRPLRPCHKPRCPNLTSRKFCAVHEQRALELARERDRQRGSAHARGYNARWERERKAFLEAHPLCMCEEHQARDDAPAGDTVDHIIPHRGDPVLFWDQRNWQTMTKRCHDRKTAREDGRWGRREGVA